MHEFCVKCKRENIIFELYCQGTDVWTINNCQKRKEEARQKYIQEVWEKKKGNVS